MTFFKNIYKIWKKELKSYFYTPLAYVFLGGFSFIVGVMFLLFMRAVMEYAMKQNIEGGEQITLERFAEAFYGNVNMILMFVIPFLTMGLFTEELRKNTLVLLLTSPIRNTEIVLAKFFAGLTIVGTMILLTLVYPIFLHYYGQGGSGIDFGVVLTTYIGLFLVSAFYIAIGLFWSSVSSSQLVAVMLSFATLFGFWLISFAAQSLPAGSIGHGILSHMAIVEQFGALLKGALETKSAIFFLSGIFLALFFTHRAVESYSWRA